MKQLLVEPIKFLPLIEGNSLETLSQSAEMAFKKYTEKDKSLCKDLQENRAEQDELQRRLNVLKEQEHKLEEERRKRSEIQQRAEMVRLIYRAPTLVWPAVLD